MNKIDQIIEILDNNDVTHYFPMANINKIAQRIAALYSSQEPQKLIPKPRFDEVYKQCVENMDKSEPQPYCITEINRDGSITYKRIQPQSVVTPTEGMELTQEQINIELFNYAYQIVTSNPIKDWNYNELIKQISKAQVAKVLKNLPTKQGIREKTQDKIARDLYKIIADNNYDMASVIRYLDKIVKLKAGQSPKEV